MVDPQPMRSINMASPIISSLTSLSPNMIEILNGVDQRKNTNYLATSLVGTVQTSPSSIETMETSESTVTRRAGRRTLEECGTVDGLEFNADDCKCGSNICTATTGKYCLKSSSLCKTHRICNAGDYKSYGESEYDPVYDSIETSGSYGNAPLGKTPSSRGRLRETGTSWVATHPNKKSSVATPRWWQITAPPKTPTSTNSYKMMDVLGVVVKGRNYPTCFHYVKTWKFTYYSDSGSGWTDVDGGNVFDGIYPNLPWVPYGTNKNWRKTDPKNECEQKYPIYFDSLISTIGIRLHAQTWNGHISARMALLVRSNVCKSCPTGKSSHLGSPSISSCIDKCPTTEVLNSDKATSDSITGIVGDSVSVTCNKGWLGSKATVCGSDKQWSPVVKCVRTCASTQVANSDKAATNSIAGSL